MEMNSYPTSIWFKFDSVGDNTKGENSFGSSIRILEEDESGMATALALAPQHKQVPGDETQRKAGDGAVAADGVGWTVTMVRHGSRVAGVNSGHSSGLGDGLCSWAGWRCLGTGPATRNGPKAGLGHAK
jgi:hypothetical protein